MQGRQQLKAPVTTGPDHGEGAAEMARHLVKALEFGGWLAFQVPAGRSPS